MMEDRGAALSHNKNPDGRLAPITNRGINRHGDAMMRLRKKRGADKLDKPTRSRHNPAEPQCDARYAACSFSKIYRDTFGKPLKSVIEEYT